jgi:hypothetical protein
LVEKVKNPDFILVGAPKCGTTALFEFLGQHPEVRLANIKEPHFFSFLGDKKPHWATKSLEEYAELFDAADPRLQGEASTWYLYSPTAAISIKRTVPRVKILAILRNPMERALSSYLFRLQNGWESCMNFEAAVRAEPERIKKGAEWDFHYVAAGLYGQQLARYYEVFPEDQIKVLLHEDFRIEPEVCLRDVCVFLGINPDFKFTTTVDVNTTKPPRFPSINRFLVKNRHSIGKIRQLLPGIMYRQLLRIKDLNRRSRPQTSDSLARELGDYYREDIKLLETLLGRALSTWLD